MPIRTFKPTTQTLRGTHLESRRGLHQGKPLKSLSFGKRIRGGRNNRGRITVRHQGGGVKQKVRFIDHRKEKYGISAVVERVEYDPNLTARIALLKYADGERRYVLAARGMKDGTVVMSGEDVLPTVGNTTILKRIPSGTPVYDVELTKGKGGQLGRSAGVSLFVQGADPSGKYIQVKMPSREIRLVSAECYATVGQVGNEDHSNVRLGKAGRKRRMGIRPTVRGMAMHAKQHPHGGGEGRGVVGRAKSIYGLRIGTKTRRNQRTRKYIIKRKVTRRVPFSKI